MDNALRTISYIADIGNIVVLMARRRMPRTASQDCIETTPGAPEAKKQYKMICHVFESEDVSAFTQKKKVFSDFKVVGLSPKPRQVKTPTRRESKDVKLVNPAFPQTVYSVRRVFFLLFSHTLKLK